MDEIVTIIQNVGFPIACVVAMFWQLEKQRQTHESESSKWVEALNRNTNVIEKLLEKLNGQH